MTFNVVDIYIYILFDRVIQTKNKKIIKRFTV